MLSFHKSLSTICVGSVGIEADGVGCWSRVAIAGVLGGVAVGGVVAFGGVAVGGVVAFGGVAAGGVVAFGGVVVGGVVDGGVVVGSATVGKVAVGRCCGRRSGCRRCCGWCFCSQRCGGRRCGSLRCGGQRRCRPPTLTSLPFGWPGVSAAASHQPRSVVQSFPYLYGVAGNPRASHPVIEHFAPADRPDYDPPQQQQDGALPPDDRPDFLFAATGTYRLVEFYVHWCDVCKNFKPHYVQLGERVQQLAAAAGTTTRTTVDAYAVSCAPNRPLCKALPWPWTGIPFFASSNRATRRASMCPKLTSIRSPFCKKWALRWTRKRTKNGIMGPLHRQPMFRL